MSSPSTPPHTPVLRDRVVELLTDAPDGVIVDATLGAAGHAAAILEARRQRHGQARLVGLDRDADALSRAAEVLADFRAVEGVHVDVARTRFDAMGDVLDDLGIDQVAGVLLDLGISSMHVDHPERGFSYRWDGPLDMRMDRSGELTAERLVNELDEDALARIISEYGEERFASRIARAIVEHRPLHRTVELAEVVRDAVPHAARRHGPHPATRTFQALRIAVNDEIGSLTAVLDVVLDRLMPGGIAVVLSYHSLEDRPVKRTFAEAASGCVCPPRMPVCACGRTPLVEHVVRRPERATDEERTANPRASSAKLRAVRRLAIPTHSEADPRTHAPMRARADADRPASPNTDDEEAT